VLCMEVAGLVGRGYIAQVNNGPAFPLGLWSYISSGNDGSPALDFRVGSTSVRFVSYGPALACTAMVSGVSDTASQENAILHR
jgi:hypothetical protein